MAPSILSIHPLRHWVVSSGEAHPRDRVVLERMLVRAKGHQQVDIQKMVTLLPTANGSGDVRAFLCSDECAW